nr:hypothetical protein BaRGS_017835 [Batillaria attramentaria]
MKTPNMDQLAIRSVRFDRAYIQYFKENGYIAEGIGKIFHSGHSGGETADYPHSWSTKFDKARETLTVPNKKASSVRPVKEKGGELHDTRIASRAILRLRDYATKPDKPFFLAVGFKKPHLPFMFPEQYQASYNQTDIPLAAHRETPAHVTELALTSFGELRNNYQDIKKLNLTPPSYRIPDDYQLDCLCVCVSVCLSVSACVCVGLPGSVRWKDVAFSQYPRRIDTSEPKMGYTLRTINYRYTEWVAYNMTTYRPIYSTLYGKELYVHEPGNDLDPEEHHNLAANSSYAKGKS